MRNEVPFKETLLLILISQVPGLFIPSLRQFAIIIPVIYYFVERRMRNRTWDEVGFPSKKFGEKRSQIFLLMLFPAVIFQLLAVIILPIFFPEFGSHILARVPVLDENHTTIGQIVFLYLIMPLTTLLEEITYRGVFQSQLTRKFSSIPSILFVSLLFAAMHWSSGALLLVLLDLSFIFIDSIFYGVLFDRSNSLIPSWMAHLIANWLAMTLLFALAV